MRTSNLGIELIKHFESLHDGDLKKIGLQPKMCPAGIWTVGYGHALRDATGKYLKGVSDYPKLLEIYPHLETITEEEADELLKEDLVLWENYVGKRLNALVTQYEFDALVSHSYNTGGSDTLFKLVNNFADPKEIEPWFCKKYISANGIVLRGLQRRRMSEWILFNTGKLKFDA